MPMVVLALSLVIVVAISEEKIFRGYLLLRFALSKPENDGGKSVLAALWEKDAQGDQGGQVGHRSSARPARGEVRVLGCTEEYGIIAAYTTSLRKTSHFFATPCKKQRRSLSWSIVTVLRLSATSDQLAYGTEGYRFESCGMRSEKP